MDGEVPFALNRLEANLTKNIAIYLFDDVEVLDFAGPFEVFTTASRVKARLEPGSPKLFEVFTLASRSGLIRARGNLMVKPAYDFGNHPAIEVLVIPGGIVEAELGRADVVDWIRGVSRKAGWSASVCTGAFLLAKAGLLQGLSATTHWEDADDLGAMFPEVTVKPDERWIEQGNVVTSAGISAGIDMSLYLVSRLVSEELALKTAKQMDYRWEP